MLENTTKYSRIFDLASLNQENTVSFDQTFEALNFSRRSRVLTKS